ncbi:hypothetical protein L596_024133 [Steinernema carpocapsae]|uniref:Secreted protein n=1 Tax=Steinernema carpocapsae TaxID=34508 RepID=A0A4U5MFU0_STECR|nr:hypothetical protein L596_024133 [Steinernema carpocapsae]
MSLANVVTFSTLLVISIVIFEASKASKVELCSQFDTTYSHPGRLSCATTSPVTLQLRRIERSTVRYL